MEIYDNILFISHVYKTLGFRSSLIRSIQSSQTNTMIWSEFWYKFGTRTQQGVPKKLTDLKFELAVQQYINVFYYTE